MEKKMEATIVYWGSIGFVGLYWVELGLLGAELGDSSLPGCCRL